jgi:hypothetical protein
MATGAARPTRRRRMATGEARRTATSATPALTGRRGVKAPLDPRGVEGAFLGLSVGGVDLPPSLGLAVLIRSLFCFFPGHRFPLQVVTNDEPSRVTNAQSAVLCRFGREKTTSKENHKPTRRKARIIIHIVAWVCG